MNDEENKMYSNLADLLNKTLENGEIPKEFAQKEESNEKRHRMYHQKLKDKVITIRLLAAYWLTNDSNLTFTFLQASSR